MYNLINMYSAFLGKIDRTTIDRDLQLFINSWTKKKVMVYCINFYFAERIDIKRINLFRRLKFNMAAVTDEETLTKTFLYTYGDERDEFTVQRQFLARWFTENSQVSSYIYLSIAARALYISSDLSDSKFLISRQKRANAI